VALRRPNVPDALGPQDGLYTVESLSKTPQYRVVGVISRALTAMAQPEKVLAALAAPETHVISLTVTEKGYCLDAHGRLDEAHPDIVRDLAAPDKPRSAIGWLARGLAERRRRGSGPVTVISCDNLLGNGRKLEAAVQVLATRVEGALAQWIERNVAFPRTVVDCIAPATTEVSRDRVAVALGLIDEACVSREPFAQWVIEDRFAGPRPAWERGSAELVADVEAHERLKLHVLNACHSTLAYLGLGRGHGLVREAIGDPELSRFVETLVAEEIAPALPDLPVADYWRKIRLRFANPMVDHRLAQIGEDGSTKLAQRIFPLLIANASPDDRPVGSPRSSAPGSSSRSRAL
jgi:fructuronate reductase